MIVHLLQILGQQPTPAACGTGSTLSYSGTTTGATAENPYSSLTCMDAPAADVWVTFTCNRKRDRS